MGQAMINCRDIASGDIIQKLADIVFNNGQMSEKGTYHAPPLPAPETFLFWNPPGGPLTTEKKITVTLFPGQEATAWYGKGSPGQIVTSAFSDGENKLLAQTPIASVVPATAWSGANSEDVSNSTSVTITAKDSIAEDSGETFDGWLQFENGVVSGATLTVPAGESCYAIASYRNHKVTIPTTDRRGLAYVTILVGIEGGGGGWYRSPDGRIHILRPDPEPWAMAPADRDLLVGLAVNEIASMINDAGARSTMKKLGVQLAQNALTRLNAEEPEK